MFASSATCAEESGRRTKSLIRLGLRPDKWDTLIALAGNPNVGKSTVFNALTGLRQHTGNWPGKTIVRAEGGLVHRDQKMKVVDLPGTYSLQAGSIDEEVARVLHAAAERAQEILNRNRDKLDTLAVALVKNEEIGEAEITEMIGPSVHENKKTEASGAEIVVREPLRDV